MNKIATTVLVSSLALAGFAVASADDDRYEREDYYEKDDRHEHDDRYERHEYRGKYCDKHGKKYGNRMFEHLDLNDEQEKQVRSIRDNFRPKMQAIRDKMRDYRKQLRETMHAETIDQEKVKKLAKTMGALKTDKIILRAEMRAEVHQVLSKEQREKMKGWKKYHGDNGEHKYHS